MSGGNVNVTYANNTSVFIDSPDRSGSGCAAGSGGFTQSGGTIQDPVTGLLNVKKLTFFVTGTSGKDLTVSGPARNATGFTASIYAPTSTIRLTGDARPTSTRAASPARRS